ncbi:MAG: MFS transporter [Spirochaetales bacterium]|jgi:MFS family permease|nr:MFS transporter [Spirochaetales bacterium]
MDTNERKILSFTSFGHFFTHFYMLVFPVLLLPITRSLGMPLEQILPKSFLMYLLYGLLAMPWGFLADHFNPRIVMGTGVIIAGTGFLLSGTLRDPAFLSLSLALVGIGCAAYHPSGLSMLSKGLKSRGKGLGLNGIFGNLGIASAPFAAGFLNYALGWQTTLLILGCVGVGIGIMCLLVPFSVDRNSDKQRGSEIKKGNALRLFIALCAVVSVFGLLYRGFTLILPSYLETRLSDAFEGLSVMLNKAGESGVLSSEQGSLFAAVVAGCAYLIGMIGQAVGGKLADRFDLKKTYIVFVCAALPFLLLLRFGSGFGLIIYAGFYAFFTLGLQPVENSLFAMLTPARWRSLAYGIKFTLVFGIGSLSVFLVTRVQNRWGIEDVILLLVGYLSVVILLVLFMNILGRKQALRHTHSPEPVNLPAAENS